MGIGVVIRNHIEDCLLACREHVDEVTAPELAQALALQRAVALTREEGFSRAIFQSDYLSVIQRIDALTVDSSPVGLITADIKELASLFSFLRFSHVNHLSNVVAHILARSFESSSDSIFHLTPDYI